MAVLEIADIARKNGVLMLQTFEATMKRSRFFYNGMMMIIDGIPHEEVCRSMRNEIASTIERHRTGVAILRRASEIAPAMGLIGTLIGLVQMLAGLDDPQSIGPAMAVALLTTLYGALFAYIILIPMASKLERNSKKEAMVMQLYLNAVESIGRKENPRRLEMLINANLPPSERVQYFA